MVMIAGKGQTTRQDARFPLEGGQVMLYVHVPGILLVTASVNDFPYALLLAGVDPL